MQGVVKAEPVPGVRLSRDLSEPVPESGEVVVEVAATSVCGTDLELYEWSESARGFDPKLPFVMGHECAGTVVAVGPEVGLGVNQASSSLLTDIDLRGVDLSYADLQRANLSKTDLRGANLSGNALNSVVLEDANLSQADLSEASLHAANLSEALLYSADLREAYLSEADLSGAVLSGAVLSMAVLIGTNLSRAKVTEHQLDRAAFLDGATLPNGQKYEDRFKDEEGRK